MFFKDKDNKHLLKWHRIFVWFPKYFLRPKRGYIWLGFIECRATSLSLLNGCGIGYEYRLIKKG